MKQKETLKLTAATFAIIGAGTILFNSAAEVTLAANNGKVEKVPTNQCCCGLVKCYIFIHSCHCTGKDSFTIVPTPSSEINDISA